MSEIKYKCTSCDDGPCFMSSEKGHNLSQFVFKCGDVNCKFIDPAEPVVLSAEEILDKSKNNTIHSSLWDIESVKDIISMSDKNGQIKERKNLQPLIDALRSLHFTPKVCVAAACQTVVQIDKIENLVEAIHHDAIVPVSQRPGFVTVWKVFNQHFRSNVNHVETGRL